MTDTTKSPKRVQIIRFPKPVSKEQLRCTDIGESVTLPQDIQTQIDAYWTQNHKGWTSSPVANLVDVTVKDNATEVRTSLTEYKNYKGVDVIARQGDVSVLNLVQSMGNEVLTQTKDGLFALPYRGDMPIAPQAYYCGGGLVALMYCAPDGAKKLRDPARAQLPPHKRFALDELTLIPEYNNPLAHVVPRMTDELGIKDAKGAVSEAPIVADSLQLMGFAYGIGQANNPSGAIYARLDMTAGELQNAKRTKIDWLEATTGKKQDQRRQEVEQEAYIRPEDLPRFLCGTLTQDALGKPLVVSPRAGKVDVLDGTIGTILLYLLHRQPDAGMGALNELGRQGHRIEFVNPVSDRVYYADAYSFKIE